MSTLSQAFVIVDKKCTEVEMYADEYQKVQDIYDALVSDYNLLYEAQQILSTVSDDNTFKATNYISETVNKTLAIIFKNKPMSINLEKVLYQNVYPHIQVTVTEVGAEKSRDLKTQQGGGIRQVISLLFTLCVIELAGSRKIAILDELVTELHPDAVEVVRQILQMFAEKGMQFIKIDHNMEPVGRVYDVVPGPHRSAKVLERVSE